MALVTDREKTAHLLRRFGFGATPAELDLYAKDGLDGAIDLLLTDAPDDAFAIAPADFTGTMGQAVDAWVLHMLLTKRPLQEKMTVFWHNHFATSAQKVVLPRLMYNQNDILRKNALGKFPELLADVSKDPAMMWWLDGQQNRKGHANENFAREVMELFTLGIGNYSEKDVQEAARAFTGWTFVRVRPEGQKYTDGNFVFKEGYHDTKPKTVLGQTGNFNGDDILKILCDQPRCAEFITHKVWDWFVWPEPDAATIAPFAKRFRDSGLDVKVLLKDIMKSKEFYSAKAERTIVKNPVDFCIPTLRQLGVADQIAEKLKADGPKPLSQTLPTAARVAHRSMRNMGMSLMFPPDVSGWKDDTEWITTASMAARIGWADRLFGKGGAGEQTIRLSAYNIFGPRPTGADIVNKLIAMFDAPVKPEKVKLMISATDQKLKVQPGWTKQTADGVALFATQLVFASPEFQFS